MKFGFRTPSIKKRISARTSWKRYIRHSVDIKMPEGYGFLTNPKKALYNKFYKKTTFGIEDIFTAVFLLLNLFVVLVIFIFRACYFVFMRIRRIDQIWIHYKQRSIDGKKSSKAIATPTPINDSFPLAIKLHSFISLVNVIDKYDKKAKKHINEARRMLRSNNFCMALPLLKKAFNLDKNNQALMYMLGVVQHVTGNYDESINILQKYIDLNPDNLDAKLVFALNYYKQDKFKYAIPILQQFPKEYSNYLFVILVLGGSFLELKQYDIAIEVFKRSPLKKRNLDNMLLQLHYLLGMAYKCKGQKANALKEFKKVYAFDTSYKNLTKEIKELEVLLQK